MATGRVKWFNERKGYGFIVPDGGGEDVFVHRSGIAGSVGESLRDGVRVEYELRQGRRGPQAGNVRPLA